MKSIVLIFILLWGCQNKEVEKKDDAAVKACLDYRSKVLESAVKEIDESKDFPFQFTTDEKAAKDLLEQYTNEHYLNQPEIEAHKAAAGKCLEKDLHLDCDYIFAEYNFFRALIQQLLTNKEWSKETKQLALQKIKAMISFYSNKSSTLMEQAISISILKDLSATTYVPKQQKVETKILSDKIEQNIKDLQILHKSRGKKEKDCSIFTKELELAESVRPDILKILSKIK